MAFGSRKSKKKSSIAAQKEAAINSIAGVAEAAFLAAASDGELTEAELEIISTIIVDMCDGDVTIKQVGKIIEACAEALDSDGFEARMDTIAEKLPDAGAQVAALYAVSAVILGDDEYDSDNEGQFYDDLAEKLEFSEELSAEIWNNQLENFGWT